MKSEHIGKLCPFCKTEIKTGDQITVCDHCDMPHHRECWEENGGCTTFGCTGSAKTDPLASRISVPREKPKITASQKEKRMDILFDQAQVAWAEDSPVLLEQITLFRDLQKSTLYGRLIFRSLSDKAITALMVELVCLDIWGTPMEDPIIHQYLDLQCKPGEQFGQTEPIPILNGNCRSIEVRPKKLMLENGSAIELPMFSNSFPQCTSLEQYYGRSDLAGEFRRRTVPGAKFLPVRKGNLTRCCCGAYYKEGNTCPSCGANYEELVAILEDPGLEEGMLAFQAEEAKRLEAERLSAEQREQEAQERVRRDKERIEAEQQAAERAQRKKKRKKRLILSLSIGIPLLCAIICAIIFIGMPYLQYTEACDALDRGDYDTAYASFTELGNLFGSESKAIETQYKKAGDLLERGSYDEAKTIYLSIDSYSDSPELVKECDYRKATAFLENGQHEEAKALFLTLGDYANSAELAKEAVYRTALALMEEKKYDDAKVKFEEISGYLDSDEQRKESIYQAGIAHLNSKRYAKALECFDLILDHKDVHSKRVETLDKWFDLSLSMYQGGDGTFTSYLKAHSDAKDYIYTKLISIFASEEDQWIYTSYYGKSHYFDRDKLMRYVKTTTIYTGNDNSVKLFRFIEGFCEAYNKDWETCKDYVRKNRSVLDRYFDYGVVQALIKYDFPEVYLEGYWTGSGYYLQFYKKTDGDGGSTTYSQYDLPWVSKPYGTKYYDIRDMEYVWIDEEHNELAKVYRFDLYSPDEMSVYCYSNGRTYYLTR